MYTGSGGLDGCGFEVRKGTENSRIYRCTASPSCSLPEPHHARRKQTKIVSRLGISNRSRLEHGRAETVSRATPPRLW
jgi:hypothetical protein